MGAGVGVRVTPAVGVGVGRACDWLAEEEPALEEPTLSGEEPALEEPTLSGEEMVPLPLVNRESGPDPAGVNPLQALRNKKQERIMEIRTVSRL